MYDEAFSLDDCSDEELEQELLRRKVRKNNYVLAIEHPTQATLNISSVGLENFKELEIANGPTTYYVRGSQLFELKALLEIMGV